jgi:hypothetical protein
MLSIDVFIQRDLPFDLENAKETLPPLGNFPIMSLRGSVTTEVISQRVGGVEIATLPPVARALKDDVVVILRKCPWGALTGENYNG